jgi:leucyl aminopeptidase
MLKVIFSPAAVPVQNAVVLTVADKATLGAQGQKLDQKLGGILKRAMSDNRFTGAAEQTLTVLAPAKTKNSRIILVGIGDPAKATTMVFENAAGVALAALHHKDAQATMVIDSHKGLVISGAEAAAHAGLGALLRSYRFDKYRTKLKPEQKPSLKSVSISSADMAKAKLLFSNLEKVAGGVFLARDLVSEPPNVIYPETLAKECLALKSLGVKVEILDERQMKKLGMGALLGVAQGSINAPRLVSMEWKGDPDADDMRPVAFVGKGVTFDSGGLSLKPPAGMEDMKWDMAGAGAVIGAMMAIAGRKAKANVVGIVGLVENMPSGMAQRPGDVVTTMSGQTVEVLNTDAEGRLVLADALWYTQETFEPRCVVDLATLTGAIIVALGHEYAGLFANDDTLSADLTKIGSAMAEPLWRMPLGDGYDKHINSPIADMKNTGERGQAGSQAGAVFLQRYIQKGVPWAHLDIAGMAWSGRDRATCPKGATAFGVRLMDRYIAGVIEKK